MDNPQSPALALAFDKQHGGFELIAGESRAVFTFLTAPVNPAVTVGQNAVTFLADKDTRVTVFQQDGKVLVVFMREKMEVASAKFSIKIDGITDIEVNSKIGRGQLGATPLTWTTHEATQELQDSVWTLHTSMPEMRVEISAEMAQIMPQNDLRFVNRFDVFVLPTPYVVAAGTRPPEWSVGVFDDANFTRPRPIRLGVPVISTVPCEGATDLTDSDITYFNEGRGAEKRTMYFRVIGTQEVESETLIGTVSQLVKLRIYFPREVDTVEPPVIVHLTYDSFIPASYGFYPAKLPVYTGQHVFHREDSVRYVDGFIYADVFVSLSVNVGLPMRMQITSDGSPYADAPYMDPDTEYHRIF